MKSVLVVAVLMSVSAQASARTVHCFSKYFGANNSTVTLDATIKNGDTLANLKVEDKNDGFLANIESIQAVDGNHKKKGPYADYQDFIVENDDASGKAYLKRLTFLLPKNLTTIKPGVRFDGYGSDPNADNSGSDGYQRLLCSVK